MFHSQQSQCQFRILFPENHWALHDCMCMNMTLWKNYGKFVKTHHRITLYKIKFIVCSRVQFFVRYLVFWYFRGISSVSLSLFNYFERLRVFLFLYITLLNGDQFHFEFYFKRVFTIEFLIFSSTYTVIVTLNLNWKDLFHSEDCYILTINIILEVVRISKWYSSIRKSNEFIFYFLVHNLKFWV